MRIHSLFFLIGILLLSCTKKTNSATRADYEVLSYRLCAAFSVETLDKHEKEATLWKKAPKGPKIRSYVFSPETDKKIRTEAALGKKAIQSAKSPDQGVAAEKARLGSIITVLKKDVPELMKLCDAITDSFVKCGENQGEKLRACMQVEQEAPMKAVVNYLNRWRSNQ